MIGLGIARLYAAQCWVAAGGFCIPVRKMTDAHLRNAISWAHAAEHAQRVPAEARWRKWLLPMLLREHARRNTGPVYAGRES